MAAPRLGTDDPLLLLDDNGSCKPLGRRPRWVVMQKPAVMRIFSSFRWSTWEARNRNLRSNARVALNIRYLHVAKCVMGVTGSWMPHGGEKPGQKQRFCTRRRKKKKRKKNPPFSCLLPVSQILAPIPFLPLSFPLLAPLYSYALTPRGLTLCYLWDLVRTFFHQKKGK